MSMYWFFEMEIVARENLLFEAIDDTLTFQDALSATLCAAKNSSCVEVLLFRVRK